VGSRQTQVVDVVATDMSDETITATSVSDLDVSIERQFIEFEHVTQAQFPLGGWSEDDQQAVLGSRFAHILAGESNNLRLHAFSKSAQR